jgi:hypothetical protein
MIDLTKELIDLMRSSEKAAEYERKINKFPSKRRSLYKLIKTNPEKDQEFYNDQLYPESKSNALDVLFVRLYYDLLDIYATSGYSHKLKKSGYDYARDRCLRQFAALRIITTKGAMLNMEYLGKHLLTKCIKYQLNELVVEVLKVLMNFYAVARQDKRLYKKYRKLYDHHNKIKMVEDELQLMFFDLYSNEIVLENRKDDAWMEDYDLEYLNQIAKADYSFKSSYYSYSVLCLIAEISKNYLELEAYARAAIDYLSNSELGNQRALNYYQKRLILATIKLNNRQEAFESISSMEKHLSYKSISWFNVKMLKAMLYVYQENYSGACDIIIECISNQFIDRVSVNIKEFIYLIYAYLAFLHQSGLLQHPHFDKKQFRLYKTLNEIPLYSSDKRGANISILIIQILFFLKNRKYDSILDRKDALQQYSYRYLRRNDTFRSNVFIRLIIQMCRADFNPIRTRTYTHKLVEQLESKPLELAEQPIGLEIIPYETLWEIILTLLEKNANSGRSSVFNRKQRAQLP